MGSVLSPRGFAPQLPRGETGASGRRQCASGQTRASLGRGGCCSQAHLGPPEGAAQVLSTEGGGGEHQRGHGGGRWPTAFQRSCAAWWASVVRSPPILPPPPPPPHSSPTPTYIPHPPHHHHPHDTRKNVPHHLQKLRREPSAWGHPSIHPPYSTKALVSLLRERRDGGLSARNPVSVAAALLSFRAARRVATPAQHASMLCNKAAWIRSVRRQRLRYLSSQSAQHREGWCGSRHVAAAPPAAECQVAPTRRSSVGGATAALLGG